MRLDVFFLQKNNKGFYLYGINSVSAIFFRKIKSSNFSGIFPDTFPTIIFQLYRHNTAGRDALDITVCDQIGTFGNFGIMPEEKEGIDAWRYTADDGEDGLDVRRIESMIVVDRLRRIGEGFGDRNSGSFGAQSRAGED